jgi:hypothetical protein
MSRRGGCRPAGVGSYLSSYVLRGTTARIWDIAIDHGGGMWPFLSQLSGLYGAKRTTLITVSWSAARVRDSRAARIGGHLRRRPGRALAKILAQVPLTTWSRDARGSGLKLEPQWTEEGYGNRTYAEFFLRPEGSDAQSPLHGHCAITTGSSQHATLTSWRLPLTCSPFPSPGPAGTLRQHAPH